jgi:hypothetical protein
MKKIFEEPKMEIQKFLMEHIMATYDGSDGGFWDEELDERD